MLHGRLEKHKLDCCCVLINFFVKVAANRERKQNDTKEEETKTTDPRKARNSKGVTLMKVMQVLEA